MAADEKREQHLFDDFVLADDDLANLVKNLFARRNELIQQLIFFDYFLGIYCHSSPFRVPGSGFGFRVQGSGSGFLVANPEPGTRTLNLSSVRQRVKDIVDAEFVCSVCVIDRIEGVV